MYYFWATFGLMVVPAIFVCVLYSYDFKKLCLPKDKCCSSDTVFSCEQNSTLKY
jgi:hypothetical protein